MKTKNIYNHPLEEKYILRNFIKAPPNSKIYIGRDGIIRNVPAHKRFVAPNGVITDLTNACDFLCREKSPIKAALNGKVFDLFDKLNKNYNKIEMPSSKVLKESEQDGNFIVISHKNDEYSIYSHLGYKTILVKKDQYVRAGELIGYSGNTGWSIDPHLHFMVFKFTKPMPAKDIQSLEVRWKK